jgi:hypothetical protein
MQFLKTNLKKIIGYLIYIFIRRPGNYYLVLPYGLGDTLYIGGLISSFKRINKIDYLTILIKSSHQFIITAYIYDPFIKFQVLPDILIKCIAIYAKNKYSTTNITKKKLIYGHFSNISDFVNSSNIISLIDKYKKFVFSLPYDSKFEKPIFNNISASDISITLNKFYFLRGKKNALIFPQSNSILNFNVSFWVPIVDILMEKGYQVYVNQTYTQKKNISPYLPKINTSLKDLYILSKFKYIDLFVSSRSGICDFFQFLETKTIIIYNELKTYAIWSIKDNSKIYELLVDKEFINNLNKII